MKAGKSRRTVFEESGLGIRIAHTGRKTFIYMYRAESKQVMWSLGVYPTISLATARIKVAKAKDDIAKGISPAREQREKFKAAKGAPTVTDLVEEYIEKWAKPRKKTWKEDQRMLYKDAVSAWGKRKAADIKRRDIIVLLDQLIERGATVTANRTLAVIRRMFNFGV